MDAKTLGGKDDDQSNGVEGGALSFYAGDGTINSFNVLPGVAVKISEISVGDGPARYWWMLGCRVMAHGPLRSIPGDSSARDYRAPQDFQNNNGSLNVFSTWTVGTGQKGSPIPLNSQLRMACGGSTVLGGDVPFPTAAVWHYKLVGGLSVADAFTLGFATTYNVPLCITRGGKDPAQTPLYDQEFKTTANEGSTGDFLYIQYPIHQPAADPTTHQALTKLFGPNLADAPVAEPQGDPPANLPVLVMDTTPLPPLLSSLPWQSLPLLPLGFRGGAASNLLADSPVAKSLHGLLGPAAQFDDVCAKRNPTSGAVVLSWKPSGFVPLASDLLEPAGLLGVAAGLGLSADQMTGHSTLPGVVPVAQGDQIVMRIDQTPAVRAAAPNFSAEDIIPTTKCTYLRLNSQIKVDGTTIPVFGEGAQWLLAGCPTQGAASSAAASNPDVCSREVPSQLTILWTGRQVKSIDLPPQGVLKVVDARSLAVAKLARITNDAPHREVGYRWGYKAAPSHCSQDRMYLVYEFRFRLQRGASPTEDDPPITVEVPGHLGFEPPSEKRIEDSWSCTTQ